MAWLLLLNILSVRLIYVVGLHQIFSLLCDSEFYEYSNIYSYILLTGIHVVSRLGLFVNKVGVKINNVGLSIKRTQNKRSVYVLPLSLHYTKGTIETNVVYSTQNGLT